MTFKSIGVCVTHPSSEDLTKAMWRGRGRGWRDRDEVIGGMFE